MLAPLIASGIAGEVDGSCTAGLLFPVRIAVHYRYRAQRGAAQVLEQEKGVRRASGSGSSFAQLGKLCI